MTLNNDLKDLKDLKELIKIKDINDLEDVNESNYKEIKSLKKDIESLLLSIKSKDDEIKDLREVIKNNNEDNYYNALCIYKQDKEINYLKDINADYMIKIKDREINELKNNINKKNLIINKFNHIIQTYKNIIFDITKNNDIIIEKMNKDIQDLKNHNLNILYITTIKDKEINDLKRNIKHNYYIKRNHFMKIMKSMKNKNKELCELKKTNLINLDYINYLSATNSSYVEQFNNIRAISSRKTNLISILNEDIINKNKEIIELKFQIKIITDISSLSCSICLEDINTNDDKYITKCNHLFHTSCLNKWGKNNTCPNCRIKL